MKFNLLTFLFLFVFTSSFSQNYNDVALIINDNSPQSIAIGNYFQNERNVPLQNVIHINCTTDEEIDSLTFEDIRSQIESSLISSNIVDSINYIVTTKGVPLKISRAGCSVSELNNCTTVDSELSLILGTNSGGISQPGNVINAYKGSSMPFDAETYGIYLVTRLDGYTQQDVLDLINRSGPNTGINKMYAQAVIDPCNTSGPADLSFFVGQYQPANDFLVNAGWNSNFDVLDPILLNQSNVFAYAISYAQQTDTIINYQWTEGSISSVFHSNSAGTFDAANSTTNSLNVADVIAEGATAGHGFGYTAFFLDGIKMEDVLSRYLDPNTNFNLAESYYSGVNFLSHHSVIIGDPKATVFIDNTASVPLLTNNFKIYPNPSNGIFTIEAGGLQSVTIYSLNGQIVQGGVQIGASFTQVDLSSEAAGTYLLNIKTTSGIHHERIVVK